ncbi:MAG: hypothetical protein AAF639_07460 [Chloroflexota bacterium]
MPIYELKSRKPTSTSASTISRTQNPTTSTLAGSTNAIIQRFSDPSVPLSGEDVNHLHQTIGTQATIQLLRQREANYKPQPVMGAVYDATWIQRLVDAMPETTYGESEQKTKSSSHGADNANRISRLTTSPSHGSQTTIQRTGFTVKTELLDEQDPYHLSVMDKFKPRLTELTGEGGRDNSTYAKIKEEVDAFNALSPLQIQEMMTKIAVLRALVKNYRNKFERSFRPREKSSKYLDVVALDAKLNADKGPVKKFEMFLYEPTYVKNKGGESVASNYAAQAVEHLKKEYAIENYNYPNELMKFATGSNRTVGALLKISDTYVGSYTEIINGERRIIQGTANVSYLARHELLQKVQEVKDKVSNRDDPLTKASPAPNKLVEAFFDSIPEIMDRAGDVLSRLN